MLDAVKLAGNTIKSKFINNGYSIAFDGAGSWCFGHLFAQIVVVFSVVNSSSIHPGNPKKKILVLREGAKNDINDNLATVEIKFSINFSNLKAKFCLHLSLH